MDNKNNSLRQFSRNEKREMQRIVEKMTNALPPSLPAIKLLTIIISFFNLLFKNLGGENSLKLTLLRTIDRNIQKRIQEIEEAKSATNEPQELPDEEISTNLNPSNPTHK